MNERAKYKLIGFIMMFCSSSLMGGIGAFTRFIDAPGDFVSFWRNFAGLIALTIILGVRTVTWTAAYAASPNRLLRLSIVS